VTNMITSLRMPDCLFIETKVDQGLFIILATMSCMSLFHTLQTNLNPFWGNIPRIYTDIILSWAYIPLTAPDTGVIFRQLKAICKPIIKCCLFSVIVIYALYIWCYVPTAKCYPHRDCVNTVNKGVWSHHAYSR